MVDSSTTIVRLLNKGWCGRKQKGGTKRMVWKKNKHGHNIQYISKESKSRFISYPPDALFRALNIIGATF